VCVHNSTLEQDYERNRLMASSLQLCAGTALILDETALAAAAIPAAAAAASNLSALRSVAQQQALPYNFGYYSLPFEVDHPVLVLTCAGRGLCEGIVHVPVVASAGDSKSSSAVGGTDEQTLQLWRTYITAVRQVCPFLYSILLEL
jgi:Mini-chromosome maintenance replisome factor